MTNAELIKALRYCADENNICTEIQNCGYYGKGFFCQDTMMHDAADAIERLMAEVDRKDKALQAWVTTWQNAKDKLIERICENCETPPDVRLRVCGECPIIQPIREVFDND